jgi:hypothetical protein
MRSQWWKCGSRLSAIALLGLSATVVQAAEDTEKPKEREIRVKVDVDKDVIVDGPNFRVLPGGPEHFITLNDIGPWTVKLSDYWLGLDCTPVSPAMRSQLKLEDEGGLVVEKVMEESPASKAGFKQYDVLLSVGDKSLKDIQHLMTLLDENKEAELSFKVLRAGEQTTVTAKPEKRPQTQGKVRDHLRWLSSDGGKAIEVLRQRLEKSGVPMRMQFFHPGTVVSANAPAIAFPDDLHVHVTKHGGKPAEIVVERGDKKWTVTEDKLGDLPEDVRPHVESLLGRLPMPKFDVEIEGTPAQPGTALRIPLPPPGEISERIEHRLEEMSRRMEQMREQINEIRENRKEKREDRRDDREERRADDQEEAS